MCISFTYLRICFSTNETAIDAKQYHRQQAYDYAE